MFVFWDFFVLLVQVSDGGGGGVWMNDENVWVNAILLLEFLVDSTTLLVIEIVLWINLITKC